MEKCRHKKLILSCASKVIFIPDEEPFKAGKIEDCGIEEIEVEFILMHYCPKCKVVKDLGVDGDISEI